MRQWLGLALAGLLLAGCGGAAAPAAPAGGSGSGSTAASTAPAGGSAKLTPVTIGISGTSINFMPVILAQQEGLFKKYGLDVKFVTIGGGTPTLQALSANQFPIAISSVFETADAKLQGLPVKLVASFVPYMPDQLVVRPDIKSAADLKGKKVSISAAGSVSDFVMRLELSKLGLDPGKDVTIVGMGGQTSRLAAMKAGSVAGTVLSPPLSNEVVQQQGYRILYDPIPQHVAINHEDVITTDRVIQGQSELLTSFLKGVADGIHFFLTQPDASKKVMASYLKMDKPADASIIAEAYDLYSKNMVPKKPYVLEDGIKLALGFIAQKDEKAKTADPASFFDNSFVQKLDQSGFIDGLYK